MQTSSKSDLLEPTTTEISCFIPQQFQEFFFLHFQCRVYFIAVVVFLKVKAPNTSAPQIELNVKCSSCAFLLFTHWQDWTDNIENQFFTTLGAGFSQQQYHDQCCAFLVVLAVSWVWPSFRQVHFWMLHIECWGLPTKFPSSKCEFTVINLLWINATCMFEYPSGLATQTHRFRVNVVMHYHTGPAHTSSFPPTCHTQSTGIHVVLSHHPPPP